MFMVSDRFPYALTSQTVQPELWFNALDTFEGLCETDIHHSDQTQSAEVTGHMVHMNQKHHQ